MSPLAPRALEALLFSAAFASGALLLRALEAHACPAPCAEHSGERLTLRPLSSRVEGVAQPLPGPDAGVTRFEVTNDWREPEEAYVSARLYDPEHPGAPRERLMRRQP